MKSIKNILSLSFTIIGCSTYGMDDIQHHQKKMNIFEYFNQEVTHRASQINNPEERVAFISKAYSSENCEKLNAENELHNQAHFAASQILSITLSPAAFEKAREVHPCAPRTCPTPNRTSPKKNLPKPLLSGKHGKFDIPPYVVKSIEWKALTY